LGTVALDGTKIHANASRHSALSYEHATKTHDARGRWLKAVSLATQARIG
jgi:hypothetical protein